MTDIVRKITKVAQTLSLTQQEYVLDIVLLLQQGWPAQKKYGKQQKKQYPNNPAAEQYPNLVDRVEN